ncbi:MAG: hypothetical protein WC588_04160 [Candidatus Micrarchaeia archaeon]
MHGGAGQAISAVHLRRKATVFGGNRAAFARLLVSVPEMEKKRVLEAKANQNEAMRRLYKNKVSEAKKIPDSAKRDWRFYECTYLQAYGGFFDDAIKTAKLVSDLLVRSFSYIAIAQFLERKGKPHEKLEKEALAFANEYGRMKKKTACEIT